MPALSPLVWILLVATPMTIAFGQVLFKMSGQKLAVNDAPFASLIWDPVFIAAVTLYGVATFAWVYVLKYVPLPYAYSFMALTFMFVPVLAYYWLGDSLTLKYVIGLLLIISGLIVVQTA